MNGGNHRRTRRRTCSLQSFDVKDNVCQFSLRLVPTTQKQIMCARTVHFSIFKEVREGTTKATLALSTPGTKSLCGGNDSHSLVGCAK